MSIPEVILMLALALVSYWLGRRHGRAQGLRAPLSRRQAAIRADLRRAENNLAVAQPRVRSGRLTRRGKADGSGG